MTETRKEHPLAAIARYKMEQANNNGGHECARWDATGKFWRVASATRKGVEHHVRLKQQNRKVAEERAALTRDQRTGFGWLFTLTCDCEAARSGLFCWHLGAVRLWWAWHHALTGDQIAERNLRARKEREKKQHDMEEDHPQFPTLEGPGDFGGMDEWDVGPDMHREEKSGKRTYNADRESWQDEGPMSNGGMDDKELERVMEENTTILLNGGRE